LPGGGQRRMAAADPLARPAHRLRERRLRRCRRRERPPERHAPAGRRRWRRALEEPGRPGAGRPGVGREAAQAAPAPERGIRLLNAKAVSRPFRFLPSLILAVLVLCIAAVIALWTWA